MYNLGSGFGMGMPVWGPAFSLGLLIIAVWSLIWKGLALWRAAKRGDMWWFIAFLFLNTLGILEIIYLFLIIKLKSSELFSKKS